MEAEILPGRYFALHWGPFENNLTPFVGNALRFLGVGFQKIPSNGSRDTAVPFIIDRSETKLDL